MSISQNFPNTRPSLNLNFARSKTLDPRITFTRTSTGTYVDESGVIRNAVADEPRFDHDPVTGECLGLLIEESRVNNYHIWNSITDTSTSINSAYIDTQIVSSVLTPRGVAATAYTATKTGNTGQYHGLGGGANSFSISSNTSVSASAYIKEFNSSDYRLLFVISAYNASTNNNRYVLYRAVPSTGTWQNGFTDSRWSVTSDVKDVGNGWYRFEISATNTYEAGWNVISFSFQLLNESNAQFYDPPTANTHGLYLSSPQYELGSFPTSYMPTNDSNGSRTPDNVSITGDNFSDWYNQSEGSILWSGGFIPEDLNMQCFSIDPSVVGDANNRIALFGRSGSGSTFVPRIRSSGNNFDPSVGAIPLKSGEIIKTILSYKLNSVAFTDQKTSTIASSTPTSLPTLNLIKIGSDYSGTQFTNGHISQLTYYPVRLPNAILQTLTK